MMIIMNIVSCRSESNPLPTIPSVPPTRASTDIGATWADRCAHRLDVMEADELAGTALTGFDPRKPVTVPSLPDEER
jgi:hypothetical protein